MKSNYKALSELIEKVNERNDDGESIVKLILPNMNKQMKNFVFLVFNESETFSLQEVSAENVDFKNKTLTISASIDSVVIIFAKI